MALAIHRLSLDSGLTCESVAGIKSGAAQTINRNLTLTDLRAGGIMMCLSRIGESGRGWSGLVILAGAVRGSRLINAIYQAREGCRDQNGGL
jgi:hypothetical protein